MKNINVGEIKQESNFEILEQCYQLFQILFKFMQTNSLREQINFNWKCSIHFEREWQWPKLPREIFDLGCLPGILQVAAVISGQPLCKCSYCYPTVCKNNVTNYQETKKSSKRKCLSRHWTWPKRQNKTPQTSCDSHLPCKIMFSPSHIICTGQATDMRQLLCFYQTTW